MLFFSAEFCSFLGVLIKRKNSYSFGESSFFRSEQSYCDNFHKKNKPSTLFI